METSPGAAEALRNYREPVRCFTGLYSDQFGRGEADFDLAETKFAT